MDFVEQHKKLWKIEIFNQVIWRFFVFHKGRSFSLLSKIVTNGRAWWDNRKIIEDKCVTTIDINIGLMYNFHISNVLELQSAWVQYHNTKQDIFCEVRQHYRTSQVINSDYSTFSVVLPLFSNRSIKILSEFDWVFQLRTVRRVLYSLWAISSHL